LAAGKQRPRRLITLGRVSGVFGVKGWVKIHSYTDPRGNIAKFGRWILCHDEGQRQVEVEQAATHGRGVVAKLTVANDREEARALIGARIAVEREALPPCAPNEYYWADLEGLSVETVGGEALGTVDHLLATGVHDVMLLTGDRQRLIPFDLDRIVRSVDLDAGKIVVDWDPDF
jgi:16S rRNA processing protein RimM